MLAPDLAAREWWRLDKPPCDPGQRTGDIRCSELRLHQSRPSSIGKRGMDVELATANSGADPFRRRWSNVAVAVIAVRSQQRYVAGSVVSEPAHAVLHFRGRDRALA